MLKKLWNVLSKPFRRSTTARIQWSPQSVGGATSWDSLLGLTQEKVSEIAEFNTCFDIPEFFARWMLRDVIVRMGMVFLASSLHDRAWTLTGGTIESRKFHEAWLKRVLPLIFDHTARCVFHGWQPLVINYKYKRKWPVDGEGFEGCAVPWSVKDLNPYGTTALIDPDDTIVGLRTNDDEWAQERCFVMTWLKELGDPHGNGQKNVIFPYWVLSAYARLWMANNAETNLQGKYALWADRGLQVFDDDGNQIQLAKIMGDALSILKNGGITSLPLVRDNKGNLSFELQPLETEDRMESFLKFVSWCDRMKLIGFLCAPGIGFDAENSTTFSDGRTAQIAQSSIFEAIGNIPLRALNEPDGLIESVHELNDLPGDPPTVAGRPYRRDQEEIFRSVAEKLIGEKLAYVDPETGEFNGDAYMGADLVDLKDTLERLGFTVRDPMAVKRPESQVEQPPGDGGRPREPMSERQGDRNHLKDR